MSRIPYFFLFPVPPQEPQIYEQNSRLSVRGEVGPYREGATLQLTCIVRGGENYSIPIKFISTYVRIDIVVFIYFWFHSG